MASSNPKPPPSGLRRVVRVRREATDSPPASALAPDSLALSLLLAARVVAAVRNGQSLTEALARLSGEPAGARAGAQDAAYGVFRHYGQGEFILQRLLSKPLSHDETVGLLLAALYRLDSRPDAPHTVVDQAVTAAGELAAGAFKGVGNGVLRNYLRQRDALRQAMQQDDVAANAHPAWWLTRLRRAFPDNWAAIVAAGTAPPPMTLRVNCRKGTRNEYQARLAELGLTARPVGKHGLVLSSPVSVDVLPGFADGAVSVQDAGAQRAAELLAPAPGARVLDACAAPGGKTAHLLESVDLDLLALDIDAARCRRIDDTLHRLGLAAMVRAGDAAEVASWWDGRPFDAILADVPCSASGVVRRHPDMKALRRESDIRPLVRTQAALLDALWPLLKPGGKLLYATCSVFAEENAAQIDAFLFRQATATCLHREQLLPGEDHDGFYYALLRKAAE